MIRNLIRKISTNPFWNKLFRNMFSATVGEAGSAVLTVLTTIIMVRVLGDTQYSTFVLAQAYMNIIDGLINFQSWAAVIKFGAERIAKDDYDGLHSIIKLGTIVDLSTAFAGMIIALFIAPQVGHLLGWNESLIICAAWFSMEIVFHFSGTSVGVLRLFNRFNLVAVQKIVVASVKCIVSFVFLINKITDLKSFVIVYVVADIIGHLLLTAMSVYVIRKEENLSLSGIAKAPTKKYSKKFWSFAFWSNLATSIDIPVKQFDVFIMSVISYEMVAVYKVYKQIGNILVELSVPISQSIMPQFSELVAYGKLKECYSVMEKLHKSILYLMVPCTIIITALSPKLLFVLFGELYAKYFYILSIFLFVRSYALSYTAVHQLFTSLGLVREDFYITGTSNIVYVIVAYFLAKEIGLLGIVLALALQVMLSINLKKVKIKKMLPSSDHEQTTQLS